MTSPWAPLLASLRAERRALALLTGLSALLVLAWYPGYHRAFAGWASRVAPAPIWAPWLAHAAQFGAGLVLLVALPALGIRLGLREPLRAFGLTTLGDWRAGLRYLAIAAPLMTPLLWIGAGDPALQAEYPLPRAAWGLHAWTPLAWAATYALYYLGWEFSFRGVLQLGLEPRLGPALSFLVPLAASTLIHVRKPFGETLSAIPGAFLLGILAWRTRSIWWPLLLHLWIGTLTDWFCWWRAGPGGP